MLVQMRRGNDDGEESELEERKRQLSSDVADVYMCKVSFM